MPIGPTETDFVISPEEVIREHLETIRKAVRFHSGKYAGLISEFDHDDIEQIVIERILRGCLNTYRGEAPLEYYLSAIVVKTCIIDFVKKRKRPIDETSEYSEWVIDTAEKPGGMDSVEGEDLETREIRDCVEKAVKELKTRQQEIFKSVIMENRSQKETAALLGISQPTVSEHLNNIRNHIRNQLQKNFPDLDYFKGGHNESN